MHACMHAWPRTSASLGPPDAGRAGCAGCAGCAREAGCAGAGSTGRRQARCVATSRIACLYRAWAMGDGPRCHRRRTLAPCPVPRALPRAQCTPLSAWRGVARRGCGFLRSGRAFIQPTHPPTTFIRPPGPNLDALLPLLPPPVLRVRRFGALGGALLLRPPWRSLIRSRSRAGRAAHRSCASPAAAGPVPRLSRHSPTHNAHLITYLRSVGGRTRQDRKSVV